MQAQPEPAFAAAYFRLLSAQRDIEAIGVFASDRGGCRLVGATQGFAEIVGAPELPRLLDARPQAGAVLRLDPRELGLPGGFAAAVGADAGLVLFAGRRPRRLTPGLAKWMRDAAPLAAPLLAAPPARPRRGRAPLRGADPAARHRAAPGRGRDARPRTVGPAGLMMLDLDRFRAVNEALGIAAGDALLAVTGTRLQQALDPGDRLIRLEGDRFVIVAPRESAALRALARRLLQAVSQPLALDGRTVVMQASIGIVTATAGRPDRRRC